MLAHFHYINKGERPFQDALHPWKLKNLARDAQLTDEQTHFIKYTAETANQKGERFHDISRHVIKA